MISCCDRLKRWYLENRVIYIFMVKWLNSGHVYGSSYSKLWQTIPFKHNVITSEWKQVGMQNVMLKQLSTSWCSVLSPTFYLWLWLAEWIWEWNITTYLLTKEKITRPETQKHVWWWKCFASFISITAFPGGKWLYCFNFNFLFSCHIAFY